MRSFLEFKLGKVFEPVDVGDIFVSLEFDAIRFLPHVSLWQCSLSKASYWLKAVQHSKRTIQVSDLITSETFEVGK